MKQTPKPPPTSAPSRSLHQFIAKGTAEPCQRQRPPCKPGECIHYSGIGYILVGFIMMNVRGFHRWQDYDPRSIIPQRLIEQGRYNSTQFLGAQDCKDTSRPVAHSYDTFWGPTSDFSISADQYWAVDLYDISGCLNGECQSSPMPAIVVEPSFS